MIANLDLFTPTEVKLKPQTADVLRLLRERGSLTQREAADLLGCWRLSGRILELRQAGHEIRTIEEPHEGGSHARYTLVR